AAASSLDLHERGDILGLTLVLGGGLIKAGGFAFEESYLMLQGFPPTMLVGTQGIWGAICMTVFVNPLADILPGNDNGSLEHFHHTVHLLHSSPTAMLLVAALFVSSVLLSLFSVM
ncbi:unnamed protein product, partial [Chrysoparadoxa australica]